MFDSLFKWIWTLLYLVDSMVGYIVGILYDFFEKTAGLDTVDYDGTKMTLIQVVFGHSLINKAYWGMAIIGVALCFFFTILAVIRKMFDSSGQVKNSLGEILTQSFKSILLICSMSMLMNMALFFSTSLMNAVQIAFYSNTTTATEEHPKTYTDSEYAAMARVLNTIGNYSLNPSYDSRYNINSCYNDIRADLQTLQNEGTFSVQYSTPDLLTNSSHYWQASLQKIVNAAPDLSADVPLDVYNSSLSEAIEEAMEEIRTDEQFKPLEEYADVLSTEDSGKVKLDRIVLLIGTMNAAYNEAFNDTNADVKDQLRAPFYYGYENHDIYDTDDMWDSFNLKKYDFIIVFFLAFVLAKNMVVIILNCIARIFNMAMLYIIAPPIIAISPLDGGSKFKQWGIAFIGQCFGVFGTVVAMDIMVAFVPIILSSQLKIFDNVLVNYITKLIIVWAGFETARKASALLTAILSENGVAAAGVGDMAREAGILTHTAGMMAGAGAAGVAKWLTGNKSGKDGKSGKSFLKVPKGGEDSSASGGGTSGGSGSSSGGKSAGAAGASGGSTPGGGSGPQKAVQGDKDAGTSAREEHNAQGQEAGTMHKADGGEADSGPGDSVDQSGNASPDKVSEGEADSGPESSAEPGGMASPDKVSEGEADSGPESNMQQRENSFSQKEKTGTADSGSHYNGYNKPESVQKNSEVSGTKTSAAGTKTSVPGARPRANSVKETPSKADSGAPKQRKRAMTPPPVRKLK